jgi:hypothetical protein
MECQFWCAFCTHKIKQLAAESSLEFDNLGKAVTMMSQNHQPVPLFIGNRVTVALFTYLDLTICEIISSLEVTIAR